MPPLHGPVDRPAPLRGFGSCNETPDGDRPLGWHNRRYLSLARRALTPRHGKITGSGAVCVPKFHPSAGATTVACALSDEAHDWCALAGLGGIMSVRLDHREWTAAA
jgi:hypothetical protein